MAHVATMLANLGRMVLGPLRERGLRETIRSVRGRALANRRERAERFDARFGTDTERHVTAEDLAAQGDDVVKLWRYAPTTADTFAQVMADARVDCEDFAFVDLGSGKGRVLLLASHYPFQRIVGVELSPSLHAVAERNVAIYRPAEQRCHEFELHCMDAAAWTPPAESNLLVYLFQPFPREVLARVLANLRASAEQHPREIVVAYLNPIFHDLVAGAGFLHRVREGAGDARHDFRWAIYTNRPDAHASAGRAERRA